MLCYRGFHIPKCVYKCVCRGGIVRTVQPWYNPTVHNNQVGLRQDMLKVAPVEIRVADTRSTRQPTKVSQTHLEHSRNL